MAGGRRRTKYIRDNAGKFASTPGGGPATPADVRKAVSKAKAAASPVGTPRSSKPVASKNQKGRDTKSVKAATQKVKNTTKSSPAETKKKAATSKPATPKTTVSKSSTVKTVDSKTPTPKAVKTKTITAKTTAPKKAATKKVAPKKDALQKAAVAEKTATKKPQIIEKSERQKQSVDIAKRKTIQRSASGILKQKKGAALRREEAAIRNQGVEHAVIVDSRGRVRTRSTSNNANKVKLGMIPVDNAIITHNHPSAGNPGYNKNIKASRLTAAFSSSDLVAGMKAYAKEMRATGETRTWRFKPAYHKWKGIRIPTQGKDIIRDMGVAESMAPSRVAMARESVKAKFNDRIKKEKSKWWNPVAQMKAGKLKKAAAKADALMRASEHYQSRNFVMRDMKKMGYDISSTRSRRLNVTQGRPKKGNLLSRIKRALTK
jgi:hypothetical protein